jgi:phospholipid/cholesterol/gamma-HCH transport system ATP-binding protein
MSEGTGRDDWLLRVEDVHLAFEGRTVLESVDLGVRRGEILALAGASGSGKSVLLKVILGLLEPARGRVEVLGVDLRNGSKEARETVQRRWGVAFQHGALFSSLSVAENVETPLREQLALPEAIYRELALLRLRMVGLTDADATKRPSQISGGMRKRASIARALVAGPEILFLDEPTSGLDPVAAAALDRLIARLTRALDLTVLMVTHDLDSIFGLADRTAVLIDGRIAVEGTIEEVCASDHPWIRQAFQGPRGRAADQAVRAASESGSAEHGAPGTEAGRS